MDTFLSIVSFLVSSSHETFVEENRCFLGGGVYRRISKRCSNFFGGKFVPTGRSPKSSESLSWFAIFFVCMPRPWGVFMDLRSFFSPQIMYVFGLRWRAPYVRSLRKKSYTSAVQHVRVSAAYIGQRSLARLHAYQRHHTLDGNVGTVSGVNMNTKESSLFRPKCAWLMAYTLLSYYCTCADDRSTRTSAQSTSIDQGEKQSNKKGWVMFGRNTRFTFGIGLT